MANGVKTWSVTSADNDDADDTINWLEGQAPSTVNDSSRAMMAAIAAWYLLIDQGTVSGGTVGGTAAAITLTCSPTVGARAAGQRYLLKLGSAITGATTLAVDGLASGAVQWRGTALVANDFSANDWIVVVDDATNYQLVTPPRVSLVTTAATQAQMEAFTNLINPVTPGRFQYHPGAVKAWANFVPRGTNGACTVNASHNVDGVSRTGTGIYVVTLTTDMGTANYVAVANTESSTALNLINIITAKAAGTCTLHQISASAGSESDLGDAIHIVFLGDQA